MTLYYKAVRPDGRDFRTGTVDYAAALASGEVLRHPTSKRMRANEAGTYLSVSVEPADCTGFRWPCRLFRVEPEGKVLGGMDYPNKRACLALRVVEELPAWQALGPNGEQVARFIENCRKLTPDDWRKVIATWDATRATRATRATWDAARDAAWDAAWDAARAAAWDAAWAAWAAWDAVWGAVWDAARDAAWDATWVIIVRDRITPEQYAALVRPFVDAGLAWVVEL